MRRTQLNPQLDPSQPLRVGWGDGISDFNNLAAADPAFASGWSEIQGQLTAESGALAQQGQGYVDAAGNYVQGAVNQAQGAVQGVVAQVQGAVGGAVGTVQGAVGQAQGLYNDAGQLIAQIQTSGSGSVADLQNRLVGAKGQFVNAFEQITQQGVGAIASDPVLAAKQFVMYGQTVAGAISTISGLIRAAEKIPTDKLVVQSLPAFTGVMLSLAAIAGTPTAGIGAVVVAGLTELISLLYQFYAPTPNYPTDEVCPGILIPKYADQTSYGGINPTDPALAGYDVSGMKLSFSVGCVGAYVGKTPQTSPGSVGWRHFPDPSDPLDAVWFAPIYWLGPGPGMWRNGTPQAGVFWSGHNGATGNGPNSPNTGLPVPNDWSQSWQRPIDCAFPSYRYLECEMYDVIPGNTMGTGPMAGRSGGFVTPSLVQSGIGTFTIKSTVTDFQKAFFAAWKTNQEYALNGFTPQDDAVVLLHLLSVWNAAHMVGAAKLVTQKGQRADLSSGAQPSYPIPCNDGQPKYYESLIQDALHVVGPQNSAYFSSSPATATAQQLQGLVLHGGDIHTVPVVPGVLGNAPATPTAGRVAAVAAASAGVAVLGAFAYSQVTGVALGTIAGRVLQAVKSPFVKFLR
jgi:hypothetical protein